MIEKKSVGYALAFCGGAALSFAMVNGGPLIELHERGHALAIQLLSTAIPAVEVPAWGRWQALIQTPGVFAKFKGACEILTDFPGRGWTRFAAPGKCRFFSPDLTSALVSAAGPLVDLSVSLTAFGIAKSQREKRPRLAAAVAGFGAYVYLFKLKLSSEAVWTSVNLFELENLWCHDFRLIAHFLWKVTGVHPRVVAGCVSAAWIAPLITLNKL